jgi:hypothetical protein
VRRLLVPIPIERIEVVECPYKTCGIFITNVPQLAPGGVFICPFCRNGFEPNERKVINVYKLNPPSRSP